MPQITHFMYGTSSTYRADAFTSASASNVKEGQITAAIAAAVTDGVQAVFVPQSMLPYNASLVTFNNAVQMIREGCNPAFYDVFAYGGAASDVYGSATAAGVAVTAAAVANSKTIQWGDGTLSFRPVISNAILTFPYDVVGRGPGTIDSALAMFNGTPDPSVYFGYNMNGLGSLLVAGEPAVAWAVEGNYNDGSGQNKMEAYVQFLATDGTYQRPFFTQYNRTTKVATPAIQGDLIQFGRGNLTNDNVMTIGNDGATGNFLTLQPCLYAGNTTYEVKAAAGQTAVIGLGVTATTLAKFQSNVSTRLDVLVNNRATAFFYATPGGGAGDAFAVGANDNGAVGTFNNTAAVGIKGVVARGKSGQTGNLFEAQDNTPTQLWAVDATGVMIATTATTAKPSIRLPHGAAPSSPTNGDMWTTTAGLFVRVNGVTVGPLT